MKHKLNIADIITLSRFVFAGLILFCAAFSMQFFACYLLGGFSDMTDGWIARKRNLKSSFGAKLDTTADFVFVSAVLIKLLPAMHLPTWIWIWVIIIAFIKLTNWCSGLVLFRRIVPIHTVMNRITGFLLFLLPFVIGRLASLRGSAIVMIAACSAATFAAIQEGHFIRTGKEIE